MLDEALGGNRAYYLRHGYHADILRDTIFETLPTGWRDRLIPVPGPDGALALDPHDLAAVKVLVGRPKDLDLVRNLHQNGRIRAEFVKERLDLIAMDERGIARLPFISARSFREFSDSPWTSSGRTWRSQQRLRESPGNSRERLPRND